MEEPPEGWEVLVRGLIQDVKRAHLELSREDLIALTIAVSRANRCTLPPRRTFWRRRRARREW